MLRKIALVLVMLVALVVAGSTMVAADEPVLEPTSDFMPFPGTYVPTPEPVPGDGYIPPLYPITPTPPVSGGWMPVSQ